jgi:hypothetical protein
VDFCVQVRPNVGDANFTLISGAPSSVSFVTRYLSVISPDARAPNGLIYLAYIGAEVLAVGVLVLGIGLVRRSAQRS